MAARKKIKLFKEDSVRDVEVDTKRDLSNASRISEYTMKNKSNKFVQLSQESSEIDEMIRPQMNFYRKAELASMSSITTASDRGRCRNKAYY